jgi:hypothetical protein
MADIVSGSLITRNYKNFKGVDFSNRKDEVSLYRSPDALNVWKNYKSSNGRCIETRPDVELIDTFDNSIYGLFFYTINTVDHMIVHSGTSLIDIDMSTNERKVIKENGMKPAKSQAFISNNILFIKDGLNYLEYDGKTIKDVEGTIPITYINCSPLGEGLKYQDHNILSPTEQMWYCADGESTEYMLKDEEINNVDKVWVNDVLQTKNTHYTVDLVLGKVIFKTAPPKPDSTGKDNVKIQYTKHSQAHRDRINKCTMLTVFDDRIFFSGNINYPNTIFHCEYNGDAGLPDPRYVSSTDYYEEGIDTAAVKAMVAGNNALWVFKEPSQANTSIFYHIPNDEYIEALGTTKRAYPNTHSSIATGCVGGAINFRDDIVFFSNSGMEGMATTDVTTEQLLAHRSDLVDSKLLNESNYKDMILEEWEGYLLVIIDNHIYLADSNPELKYEWYYWQLDMNVTCTSVKDGVLYLCGDNKIYTLTNIKEDRNVEAYWTTLEDEFKYPQYLKTTNKKGCVIDAIGDITVSMKTDNNEFEKIKSYSNTKGYISHKKKKKKWKSISMKFSSNKPFSLYSATLESWVGGYVKR